MIRHVRTCKKNGKKTTHPLKRHPSNPFFFIRRIFLCVARRNHLFPRKKPYERKIVDVAKSIGWKVRSIFLTFFLFVLAFLCFVRSKTYWFDSPNLHPRSSLSLLPLEKTRIHAKGYDSKRMASQNKYTGHRISLHPSDANACFGDERIHENQTHPKDCMCGVKERSWNWTEKKQQRRRKKEKKECVLVDPFVRVHGSIQIS